MQAYARTVQRSGSSVLTRRHWQPQRTLPRCCSSFETRLGNAESWDYTFGTGDIECAAAVLASARQGRAPLHEVADVAHGHGWDLVSDGKPLEASGFRPFAFCQSQSMMLAFHGTDINHPRQVASAIRSAVLGFVPHAFYLEALMWACKIICRHQPKRVILAGFSMGGALSEMLAVHFTSPCGVRRAAGCVDEFGAVTFESPSFPLKAFKDAVQLDGDHDSRAILQYKSAPNLLNTLFPPVGAELRRVAIPHCDDISFHSSDAFADAGRLILDCVALSATLKDPLVMLKTGVAASVAKAVSVYARGESQWFHRQHSMLHLSKHLNVQHSVYKWPRWLDVSRPRLNMGHLSFQEVVPVFGPAAQLIDKLGNGSWEQCMENSRLCIEEHVRNTPGFLQCGEPIPREKWTKGARCLEVFEEGEPHIEIRGDLRNQLLGALRLCLM